jgi:hypothetical protein
MVFGSHCPVNHKSAQSALGRPERVRYKESMTTRALVGLFVVNLSLAAQDGPLHLVVLEGDGAINNIRSSRAKEPVIRVEDANNQGVPGAVVTFQLPNGGASGFFGDGGSSLTLTADDRGEAVARRLHANRIAGTFQIRVSASLGGRMAAASITQTNVDPGSHPSSRKIALLAVLGGVAAGGAALAFHGKAKSPSPASPATVVVPGTPAIGGPE